MISQELENSLIIKHWSNALEKRLIKSLLLSLIPSQQTEYVQNRYTGEG